MLFRYRRLHRYTIMLTSVTSSTSRYERCIHDIVSTSFTSMYYPVNIVDIAMWTMYTRYHVLSCLHRRHRRRRDVNVVYTISCQRRLQRCTILFTSSTSLTSRCERSMYTRYRVNIVHIDVYSIVFISSTSRFMK